MRRAPNTFPGMKLGHDIVVTGPKFTEDIVILEEDAVTVQPILDHTVCETKADGLVVNTLKTKISTTLQDLSHAIYINGDKLEPMRHFTYTNFTTQPNYQAKDEVRPCARRAFLQLREILGSSNNTSLQKNLRIYRAPVYVVLRYAREA